MARKARSKAEKDKDLALGRRIAAVRKERGYTQVELADQLGTTQAIVSDYERGKLRPHPEMIVRLAKALRVSTDELLGVKPPSQNGVTCPPKTGPSDVQVLWQNSLGGQHEESIHGRADHRDPEGR